MNRENNIEKLMKIKNQIEEAKFKRSEIKGKKENIEAQIKDKFGIKISDIDTELDKMETDLDKKELEFQEGIDKLNEDYSWD